MPAPTGHLTSETLEQFAEGSLPASETAPVDAHLQGCERCSAELDTVRSLFTMLEDLPRFAPSPAFGDAVMARVQIAPQESRALAWLRRWVPSTRRGWVLLGAAAVAPVVPLLALVAWVLSQPLLSPSTLAQWATIRTQSAGQAAAAWLFETAMSLEVADRAGALLDAMQALPTSAVGGAVVFLGIAMPLSAWTLIRLTRTPMGSVTHAN